MTRKTYGKMWKALLGILATAVIGWCGTMVGAGVGWGLNVNASIAKANEAVAVQKATNDTRWDAINKALYSIDQRLGNIERRLDK